MIVGQPLSPKSTLPYHLLENERRGANTYIRTAIQRLAARSTVSIGSRGISADAIVMLVPLTDGLLEEPGQLLAILRPVEAALGSFADPPPCFDEAGLPPEIRPQLHAVDPEAVPPRVHREPPAERHLGHCLLTLLPPALCERI